MNLRSAWLALIGMPSTSLLFVGIYLEGEILLSVPPNLRDFRRPGCCEAPPSCGLGRSRLGPGGLESVRIEERLLSEGVQDGR